MNPGRPSPACPLGTQRSGDCLRNNQTGIFNGSPWAAVKYVNVNVISLQSVITEPLGFRKSILYGEFIGDTLQAVGFRQWVGPNLKVPYWAKFSLLSLSYSNGGHQP